MFLHADTIVKAVMIGLAIASLVTWTVWVAKSIELFGARVAVRRGLRVLAESTTLAQARQAAKPARIVKTRKALASVTFRLLAWLIALMSSLSESWRSYAISRRKFQNSASGRLPMKRHPHRGKALRSLQTSRPRRPS
jgi:hypothetical protein